MLVSFCAINHYQPAFLVWLESEGKEGSIRFIANVVQESFNVLFTVQFWNVKQSDLCAILTVECVFVARNLLEILSMTASIIASVTALVICKEIISIA